MSDLYLRDLREGLKDDQIRYVKREAERGDKKAEAILKVIKANAKGVLDRRDITIGKIDRLEDWEVE